VPSTSVSVSHALAHLRMGAARLNSLPLFAQSGSRSDVAGRATDAFFTGVDTVACASNHV
jgi:hypothetical protein